MTDTDKRQHRSILQEIAHRAMLKRGLVPDVPLQALAELDGIRGPATGTEESTRDLRNLLWCSIDNDDSRNLDQLSDSKAVYRQRGSPARQGRQGHFHHAAGGASKYGRNRRNLPERVVDVLRAYLAKYRPARAEIQGSVVAE